MPMQAPTTAAHSAIVAPRVIQTWSEIYFFQWLRQKMKEWRAYRIPPAEFEISWNILIVIEFVACNGDESDIDNEYDRSN